MWRFGAAALLCHGRESGTPLSLDLYIDIHQRNCSRRYSGNSGSVAQSTGTDFDQLLLHFAREPAHRFVIKPLGNRALLGLLQPLNRPLLLLEIAFVFDLRLDRLEFIAQDGREAVMRRRSYVARHILVG